MKTNSSFNLCVALALFSGAAAYGQNVRLTWKLINTKFTSISDHGGYGSSSESNTTKKIPQSPEDIKTTLNCAKKSSTILSVLDTKITYYPDSFIVELPKDKCDEFKEAMKLDHNKNCQATLGLAVGYDWHQEAKNTTFTHALYLNPTASLPYGNYSVYNYSNYYIKSTHKKDQWDVRSEWRRKKISKKFDSIRKNLRDVYYTFWEAILQSHLKENGCNEDNDKDLGFSLKWEEDADVPDSDGLHNEEVLLMIKNVVK